MTTQKRSVLICDNEGCGKEVLLPVEVTPETRPNGIYISAGTIMRSNGYTIMKDVFVCSGACLVPAINDVFERGTEN